MIKSDVEVILMQEQVVYLYHGKVRVYCIRSLFLFHGDNPIRRLAAYIIESR